MAKDLKHRLAKRMERAREAAYVLAQRGARKAAFGARLGARWARAKARRMEAASRRDRAHVVHALRRAWHDAAEAAKHAVKA